MNIKDLYLKFRSAGYNAGSAISSAKTCLEWRELGDENVRLGAEPELESYFDIYGEPEGYTNVHGRKITAEQERKELIEYIERNGLYCAISYYRDMETDQWIAADSVGMCCCSDPLSPFQNYYVPSLMRAAIDAYKNQSFAVAI